VVVLAVKAIHLEMVDLVLLQEVQQILPHNQDKQEMLVVFLGERVAMEVAAAALVEQGKMDKMVAVDMED